MSNVFTIEEAENKNNILRVISVGKVIKGLSANPLLGVSKEIKCSIKKEDSFSGNVIGYYVTSSLITIENNKKILVRKEGAVRFNKVNQHLVTKKELQRKIEQLKISFEKDLRKYQKFSFIK